MFQFPRFPSIRYGLAYGYMRVAHVGFPIRISPDRRIFAPPRSFSQLITSFIGSQCQGIHPALLMLDLSLVRCHYSVSDRLLCSLSIRFILKLPFRISLSGLLFPEPEVFQLPRFDNISHSRVRCLGCLFPISYVLRLI